MTPDREKQLKTVQHQTHLGQLLPVQEKQALHEQTLRLATAETDYAKAKDLYENADVITQKSLERGSPPSYEHEV